MGLDAKSAAPSCGAGEPVTFVPADSVRVFVCVCTTSSGACVVQWLSVCVRVSVCV